MHIAYYSPAWPPVNIANGIATYVSQMKNALEKRGHRVTVFTSDAIYAADGEVIELGRSKPKMIRRLLNRFSPFSAGHVAEGTRLAVAVKEHCPDVDLVEMEESFGFVTALQNNTCLPVIVRLHGPHFLCQLDTLSGESLRQSDLRTKNEGDGIKSARYLSAPSLQTLASTAGFYGAKPHIAEAIYNPAPEYQGIPWCYQSSNRFEILHVGRFDRLKGADVIIQAFCLIASKYKEARLIIVGPDRGLQVDTDERLNFDGYCQKFVPAELHSRVLFKGSRTQMEINEFRLHSHISVIPSRFETMSYAALETLSVGAPLVCADSIADNALVIDGETGWQFKNGSAESLADSINKAFESGEDIQRIANAGRAYCQAHFHPDVVAPKMISFYETVLKDYHSK